MQGIQQTSCVDVVTLRLCKASSDMVQIENKILGRLDQSQVRDCWG